MLASWASEPNPFYESWFLLPVLEQFDPQGSVMIFTLEANGGLVGLMPLHRDRKYYGYPLPNIRGWTHDNCFLGAPLVARGFEKAFWEHLLAWADRTPRLSLFLHLVHMPTEGPLHAALAETVAAQDRPAAKVMHEERAMLASSLGPEEYYANALSTKKRKELRRQHRRLGELGKLEATRLTDSDTLGDWCQEFLELEARGWKGSQQSALASDRRTERMFRRALSGAARRGRLECLTLRLDGRAIAMLANFLTPPGGFSFKTTFDEEYARYSPGVLLQHENLEILYNSKIDWMDSCAAPDHPMINHLWRERRSIARYSIAIGGSLRQMTFAQTVRLEAGAASGGIT